LFENILLPGLPRTYWNIGKEDPEPWLLTARHSREKRKRERKRGQVTWDRMRHMRVLEILLYNEENIWKFLRKNFFR
jgi:hypothetical protein